MANPDKVTTVCCPGKVLVAGGYLVLESPNPGVVLGSDGELGSSRFFASVTCLPSSNANANDDGISTTGIYTGTEVAPRAATGDGISTTDVAPRAASDANVNANANDDGISTTGTKVAPRAATYIRQCLDVHSPQFDTIFCYWLDYMAGNDTGSIDDDGAAADKSILLKLTPRNLEKHRPNPFVEKALALTLAYVQCTLGIDKFAERMSMATSNGTKILSVKLRAGNDFYSPLAHLKERNLEATPGNVASLPRFLPCPKVRDETTGEDKVVVNKTGMGSSAA